MLERRAFKKWGKDPKYLAYLKETPEVWPNPVRLASALCKTFFAGPLVD
jgi:hypothetical protein